MVALLPTVGTPPTGIDMSEYNELHTPEKGTEDWHILLNENFDLIEDDFRSIHDAIGDLSNGAGHVDLTDIPGIDSTRKNVGALVGGTYHDSRTDDGGYGTVFEAADITIHSVVMDAEHAADVPVELREFRDDAEDPPVVDSTTVSLNGGSERVELGFDVPASGNGDPEDRYILARGPQPDDPTPLRRRWDSEGDWSAAHYDNERYTDPEIEFLRGAHTGEYADAGNESWYFFFDWLIGDERSQTTAPWSTDVEEIYMRATDPAEEFDDVSPRALWIDTS